MKAEDYRQLPTDELLNRVLGASRMPESDDSEERWFLVSALHARPEQTVFDTAVAWCRSSIAVERAVGADILGQLGAGSQPRPLPFAAESTPILVRLRQDSSDQVVESALIALGHLNAGEPDQIASLGSHPSPDVRHAVAFALGGREDGASLQALLHLSSDDDRDVRDWATFALGTLSEADRPEIRTALVERLSDEDPEIRGEAMLGLACRGDTRAVVAIVRELEVDEPLCLAIEAAEHLPSQEFLPHLERLLGEHPNDKQIQAAVQRCRKESSR